MFARLSHFRTYLLKILFYYFPELLCSLRNHKSEISYIVNGISSYLLVVCRKWRFDVNLLQGLSQKGRASGFQSIALIWTKPYELFGLFHQLPPGGSAGLPLEALMSPGGPFWATGRAVRESGRVLP